MLKKKQKKERETMTVKQSFKNWDCSIPGYLIPGH